MKRAIIAALAAAMLTQGTAFAQEDSEAAGPAVTEPEGTGAEVAADPKKQKKGATEAGVDQVAETYTVKPGDTLWDLSQRFLGNPWYWPKVWSYNPEIENPHWIYPGNTVRFFPSTEELPAQVDAKPNPEDDGPLQAPNAELADVSSGNFNGPETFGEDSDVVSIVGPQKIGFDAAKKKNVLRQDGLVTQKELDDAGVIDRSFMEKDLLSTYDQVYIRFRNTSGVRPGERYVIYRTIDKLKHPTTGEDFGFLTHVVGSLRVKSIDKNNICTAVIDHTFEDISRGDFVGPWGAFDKEVLTKDSTREINGVIVASQIPRQRFMGENHIIFIDKGKKDGVEEGNVFSVIRQGDPLVRDPVVEEQNKYPREDVATIVIVDVKENASAGLVVRAIREVAVGDRVEMRPAGHAER